MLAREHLYVKRGGTKSGMAASHSVILAMGKESSVP